MPAPSGVRLRESCQACAVSKVKCSKDRPTCARCADRGTACEYLVTKKTGRKVRHHRAPSQSTSSGQTSESNMASIPSMSPPAMTSDESTPDFDFTDLDLNFGPLDTALLSSAAPDYCSLLMTPLSTGWPCPSPQQQQQHSRAPSSSHMPDTSMNMCAGLPGASKPDFGHPWSQPQSPCPEAVQIALQLMGQLCSLQDQLQSANLTSAEVGVCRRTLTATNKMMAESVAKILECGGSDDGHCLVIVCLAISKLLDGYTKAAESLGIHHEHDWSSEPGSLSSRGSSVSVSMPMHQAAPSAAALEMEAAATASGGERLARTGRDAKAVPELLDDLYQLRSLLDHLGTSIRACLNRSWEVEESDSSSSSASTGRPHTPSAFPFSATIMNQLYDELRRRLSAISLGVLAKSKQFWVQ